MSRLAFRPQARTATIGAVVLFHVIIIYLFVLSIGALPVPVPTDFQPWKALPPEETPVPAAPPIPTHPLLFPRTLPPAVPEFGRNSGTTGVNDLVAPRLDPRYPPSRPDYPAASVRLGEEGSVLVALLVGPDGGVGEARIAKSSGHPALDQAALEHARRHLRFLPGTNAGMAVAMWHNVTMTFRLSEAQGN